MLDNKELQLIRDKILGVTSANLGDLNSTVYLQQIRDALLSVAPAQVMGNLHEKIYLQQVRNAILGVPDGQFGSLPNDIYLQQIMNAFNGVPDGSFGSMGEDAYLDLAVVGPLLGPELVNNWNMEVGSPPAGWTAGIDLPILTSVFDERTGGSGSKSLDIAIGVGQITATAILAVTVPVGPHRFRRWAKNINADHLANVIYADGFLSTLYVGNDISPMVWTEYSNDFTSVSTGGFLVTVVVGTPGQHARIDDFSIKNIV